MSKQKQFTIEKKNKWYFLFKKRWKKISTAYKLGVGKGRDRIEQEFQNENVLVKKLWKYNNRFFLNNLTELINLNMYIIKCFYLYFFLYYTLHK